MNQNWRVCTFLLEWNLTFTKFKIKRIRNSEYKKNISFSSHKDITTGTFLMIYPLNIYDLKCEELFLLIKLLTFKTIFFPLNLTCKVLLHARPWVCMDSNQSLPHLPPLVIYWTLARRQTPWRADSKQVTASSNEKVFLRIT